MKTHQPLQAMPSAVSKLEKSVDHDSKKCLGCQVTIPKIKLINKIFSE